MKSVRKALRRAARLEIEAQLIDKQLEDEDLELERLIQFEDRIRSKFRLVSEDDAEWVQEHSRGWQKELELQYHERMYNRRDDYDDYDDYDYP